MAAEAAFVSEPRLDDAWSGPEEPALDEALWHAPASSEKATQQRTEKEDGVRGMVSIPHSSSRA